MRIIDRRTHVAIIYWWAAAADATKKRKMINAESPRPSRSTTVAHTFSVSCWQFCDDNSSQLFGTRFLLFFYWRRRKGRRRSTSEMSTSLVPPVVHFFCFPVLAICIRIYAERCCDMSQPRKFLRIIVVFRHRKSGVNAEMFSYSLYDYTSIITYTAHTFRVIYWYSRRVYYNIASRSRTGNHLVTQKR
jgi:hypothetical protein